MSKTGPEHVFRYTHEFSETIICAAHGACVRDRDGREILDFTSGQMSAILGHAQPEIVATVSEAVARLDHLHSSFLCDVVIDFTDALSGLLPDSLSKVLPLSPLRTCGPDPSCQRIFRPLRDRGSIGGSASHANGVGHGHRNPNSSHPHRLGRPVAAASETTRDQGGFAPDRRGTSGIAGAPCAAGAGESGRRLPARARRALPRPPGAMANGQDLPPARVAEPAEWRRGGGVSLLFFCGEDSRGDGCRGSFAPRAMTDEDADIES